MVWPSLISVAVTPGVSFAPAPLPTSVSPRTAIIALLIDMFPSSSREDGAEEARRAGWHHHHDTDEDRAVDRSGRGIREFFRDARHELDEGGPEDHAEDRADAADDRADQKIDREEHGEAVGRHEP